METQPPFDGPAITIVYARLEPEGITKTIQRPKLACQLLEALGYMEESALVIRDNALLTPDRRIWPGDCLIVRAAGSRG